MSDQEQKRVALGYLQEAWAEARLDGIDGDCLAQACLFAALAEFVSTYGEEAAATFAAGLGERIRNGEFSRRTAAPIALLSAHRRFRQAEMAFEQGVDVGRIERLLQEGERAGGLRALGDGFVKR